MTNSPGRVVLFSPPQLAGDPSPPPGGGSCSRLLRMLLLRASKSSPRLSSAGLAWVVECFLAGALGAAKNHQGRQREQKRPQKIDLETKEIRFKHK